MSKVLEVDLKEIDEGKSMCIIGVLIGGVRHSDAANRLIDYDSSLRITEWTDAQNEM
jgi:hypothetical protein